MVNFFKSHFPNTVNVYMKRNKLRLVYYQRSTQKQKYTNFGHVCKQTLFTSFNGLEIVSRFNKFLKLFRQRHVFFLSSTIQRAVCQVKPLSKEQNDHLLLSHIRFFFFWPKFMFKEQSLLCWITFFSILSFNYLNIPSLILKYKQKPNFFFLIF